jgi:hypothetical protein
MSDNTKARALANLGLRSAYEARIEAEKHED